MRAVFLGTILLASCAGSIETSQGRAVILAELRKCRDALPVESNTPFSSPCANRDVSALDGVSKAEIESALGRPDLVASSGSVTSAQGAYERAATWSYSFYRLPVDYLGGGPELLFEFNSNDVARAKWVHTE